jgi:UDP-glucose 4-epimerase
MNLSEISGKRVIVTGGAGFIGSHLVDRLAALQAQVMVIDNFASGKMSNLRGANVRIARGDISQQQVWKVRGIDYVFHLAAGSLLRSFEDPALDLSVNALGALNAMECARKNDAKLVYASSGSVYGNAEELPTKETSALNPTSPYAVSKLAGEMYVRMAYRAYGLQTTCLRYFNVYGPRQVLSKKIGVVPIFISRATKNAPLIVHGSGKQTRDFTYVSDVVDATISAPVASRARGKVINVGTGRECAVIELAKMIIELSNGTSKIVHGPRKAGDIERLCADIDLALETLGFSPKISLREGIVRCISDFKAY